MAGRRVDMDFFFSGRKDSSGDTAAADQTLNLNSPELLIQGIQGIQYSEKEIYVDRSLYLKQNLGIYYDQYQIMDGRIPLCPNSYERYLFSRRKKTQLNSPFQGP